MTKLSKYEVLMEYKCSETHYVWAESEEEAVEKVQSEEKEESKPEINVHYWELKNINKVEEEKNNE